MGVGERGIPGCGGDTVEGAEEGAAQGEHKDDDAPPPPAVARLKHVPKDQCHSVHTGQVFRRVHNFLKVLQH